MDIQSQRPVEKKAKTEVPNPMRPFRWGFTLLLSLGNRVTKRLIKTHAMIRSPSKVSPGKLPTFRRRISSFSPVLATVFVLNLGAAIATGQGDEYADEEGARVLTRGPVHEAFAEMVSYNPEPGIIVRKALPEDINEIPPEVRPDGDNITWIPGYWGWDDERDDYLWISGTWRALPPGRQWTTGYWAESIQGHQWISGYWAESTTRETTYLPRPPITVEAGSNIAAPSNNYNWSPGSWMWQQERYAWRPGYWTQGRSDWDWIPAHYVWTPRGYVFVDGYWDYSFERRGVLYAPVHFQGGYQSRPGYSYSPVIAISLNIILEHLFLRPTYRHYYFGDYYDRRYQDNGYYSPYAYQSARRGHDPIYSYRSWTHREDRDWERNFEASYDYRRDNESARPPRTWVDQKSIRPSNAEAGEGQLLIAAPFQEIAKRKDSQLRVQQVSDKERQQLTEVRHEIEKVREQRRAIEKEGSGKTEENIKPTRGKQPASPIVGKLPKDFDKKQAPPELPRNPGIEPEKTKFSREPATKKIQPEAKHQTKPDESATRKEALDRSREEAPPPKKEQPPSPRKEESKPKKQQPEPEQRMDEPEKESQPSRQPKAKERERETQPERRQPSKPAQDTKPEDSGKQKDRAVKPPIPRQPASDKEVSEKSPEKSRNKEHR